MTKQLFTTECEGHPANVYGPAGVTEYCDGTCEPDVTVDLYAATLVDEIDLCVPAEVRLDRNITCFEALHETYDTDGMFIQVEQDLGITRTTDGPKYLAFLSKATDRAFTVLNEAL